MPSPAWEDLCQFLDLDDFAVVGVLSFQGGGTRRIGGIFDEPSINAQAGNGFSYDTTGPVFIVREVDVAGVNQNDQITIFGRLFDITALPEVDGTGTAVLRLAPTYGEGGR